MAAVFVLAVDVAATDDDVTAAVFAATTIAAVRSPNATHMSGDILRGLIQAAGIPPLCIASSFTKCMNTTWCAHDVRRGLNGSGGVVIFPLNGRPRRQDFHPYHDAMRLWWLLEYAFVAHKLRLSVYRGESWPWKVVGPMGQALLSALDEHGVRPLPKGGCPGCTELRLDNWTISPWGDDSKLFLSWPGATSAVWHKMQHECRNISTHYGRASPSSLWWEAPRGSSDARAADQVIHQAPTHRCIAQLPQYLGTERAAAERAAAERAVEVSAMPRSAAASEVQAEVQVRTRKSSTARVGPGGGWYEELELRHGGKGRPRRPRSS